MEKLRIHKTKYRNRGMANKKLKGLNEYHVIFKFDTEEKATDFITKVKEWYYSLEEVRDKIKTALKDETKTPEVKKSPPAKRKTGRPPKKNIQGQKRERIPKIS